MKIFLLFLLQTVTVAFSQMMPTQLSDPGKFPDLRTKLFEMVDVKKITNRSALPRAPAGTQVEISVLYSALDPQSQTFFTKHLIPVWEQLKDVIKIFVDCYPSGKVELSDTPGELKCENGPEECEAHRLQNCIHIHDDAAEVKENGIPPLVPGQVDQIRILGCLMANGKKGSPYPMKKCFDDVLKTNTDALLEKVKKCMEVPPAGKSQTGKHTNWDNFGHTKAVALVIVTGILLTGLELDENYSLPVVVVNDKMMSVPDGFPYLKNIICLELKSMPAECGGSLAAPTLLLHAIFFLLLPLLK